jgi:hypothetical protein
MDGVVVSERCADCINHKDTPIEVILNWKDNSAESRTREILELAKKNKWNRVGTIAYGNNEHRGILTVLDEWNEDYPKVIKIFFMESDDFNDLKSMFEKIEEDLCIV